ncbi:MAG TPA: type II secretion system F family protein, partial [Acidobacteriota bacterium]|nr:type II secretion system F family protein [Acidobacteriota bacterium]
MPTFVYKGRNHLNEVVVGEKFAPSRDQLEQLLRRDKVSLLSAKEKGKEVSVPRLGGSQKVKAKELAIFTKQFSVMIDAGLPLVQCLEILGGQQENKYFKQVLLQVRADVEQGMTLSDSMSRHPKVFEQLYVNMVAAGETGGILDVILQRLSIFIEKIVKLKGDVVSALIYPSAVIILAVVVISIIMIVVIPAFKTIFEGLLGPGERLPLPTEIVIMISNFMGSYWWILVIFIGMTSYGLKSYYATPGGQRNIDQLMLKIPVIGPILLKVAVARFSRTLATLLSSGVP